MESFGIGIVNESYGDRDVKRWLFSFGAHGTTHVLVIGVDYLEDALESAAEWLADHAPGHIMECYGEEHTDLIREACVERGGVWAWIAYQDHDSAMSDETRWDIEAEAESDLTRTESGFLASYEWGVNEDPSREEILDLQKRHMYDTPGRWYYVVSYAPIGCIEVVRCRRLTQGGKASYCRPCGTPAKVRGHLTLTLRDEATLAYLDAQWAAAHPSGVAL